MEPTNNFEITPFVAPAEWNELAFAGFYMYQRPLGSNANEAPIIESTGPIGETVVNNWQVYDGPGSDAKVVARAQGLHIQAGNWLCSFSLVFENERFSGSTLEVMGITVESGEWAVVGGTGEFAMATGVISKKLYERRSDGNIIQLTIRALCLRGIRYPVIKIGPWGGNGGSPLDIITDASSIKHLESVTIRSGLVVNSIQFSYVDSAGQTRSAGPWGGSSGQAHTIQLAESEFITQVSGTIGSYGGVTAVTSIKFVTSLKSYGPWGQEKGTPFTVPVQTNGGIVGFFARGGSYLNAIGVYVRPL
ncbi:unnamed protein product [Urochloa decumbens]|uniref:Dirigent protein n=1 Tax=Urochloa decumbens TaxID=240449 RepID=A0ABC9GAC1_9POAL